MIFHLHLYACLVQNLARTSIVHLHSKKTLKYIHVLYDWTSRTSITLCTQRRSLANIHVLSSNINDKTNQCLQNSASIQKNNASRTPMQILTLSTKQGTWAHHLHHLHSAGRDRIHFDLHDISQDSLFTAQPPALLSRYHIEHAGNTQTRKKPLETPNTCNAEKIAIL